MSSDSKGRLNLPFLILSLASALLSGLFLSLFSRFFDAGMKSPVFISLVFLIFILCFQLLVFLYGFLSKKKRVDILSGNFYSPKLEVFLALMALITAALAGLFEFLFKLSLPDSSQLPACGALLLTARFPGMNLGHGLLRVLFLSLLGICLGFIKAVFYGNHKDTLYLILLTVAEAIAACAVLDFFMPLFDLSFSTGLLPVLIILAISPLKYFDISNYSVPSNASNSLTAKVHILKSIKAETKSGDYKTAYIICAIIAILSLALIISSFSLMPSNGSEKTISENQTSLDFEQEKEILNEITEEARSFEDENGFIAQEFINEAIDFVYNKASSAPGVDVCEKDEYGVYVKMESGLEYVYIPPIEGADSGSGLQSIITLQPSYTETKIHEQNTFSSCDLDGPDICAFDLGFLDANWNFNNNDNLDDSDVSLDRILDLDRYKMILWNGHGGYSSYTGFFLGTNIDVDRRLLNNPALHSGNYLIDMSKNRLLLKPQFFRDNFSDNAFENAFIYFGTCFSGKSRDFAQVFTDKGAAVVFVNEGLILNEYNLNMMRLIVESFCLGHYGSVSDTALSLMGSSYDPNRWTIADSLTIAKDFYGYVDPVYGSGVYYIGQPGVDTLNYNSWLFSLTGQNGLQTGWLPDTCWTELINEAWDWRYVLLFKDNGSYEAFNYRSGDYFTGSYSFDGSTLVLDGLSSYNWNGSEFTSSSFDPQLNRNVPIRMYRDDSEAQLFTVTAGGPWIDYTLIFDDTPWNYSFGCTIDSNPDCIFHSDGSIDNVSTGVKSQFNWEVLNGELYIDGNVFIDNPNYPGSFISRDKIYSGYGGYNQYRHLYVSPGHIHKQNINIQAPVNPEDIYWVVEPSADSCINPELWQVKSKYGKCIYMLFGPSLDYHNFDTISEAETVTVLARQNGFSYVECEDGRLGWCRSALLVPYGQYPQKTPEPVSNIAEYSVIWPDDCFLDYPRLCVLEPGFDCSYFVSEEVGPAYVTVQHEYNAMLWIYDVEYLGNDEYFISFYNMANDNEGEYVVKPSDDMRISRANQARDFTFASSVLITNELEDPDNPEQWYTDPAQAMDVINWIGLYKKFIISVQDGLIVEIRIPYHP